MKRLQLREAVKYTGMPRTTIKSRRDTLRENPEHPDRKHLHPTNARYQKLVESGKNVQWELDVEILDRWKQEWRQRKAKTSPDSSAGRPTAVPPTIPEQGGGVVDLLREELKTRKQELDEERQFFREQLEKERTAFQDLNTEHRQQLSELNREIRVLSVENKELKMLTTGIAYGATAGSNSVEQGSVPNASVPPKKPRWTQVIDLQPDPRRTLLTVLSTLGICLGLLAAAQLAL